MICGLRAVDSQGRSAAALHSLVGGLQISLALEMVSRAGTDHDEAPRGSEMLFVDLSQARGMQELLSNVNEVHL